MTKSEMIENLRIATEKLQAKNNGRYYTFIPSNPTDKKAFDVWHKYNSAFVALANQIHFGIDPTSNWDELDPLCRSFNKEAASEIIISSL